MSIQMEKLYKSIKLDKVADTQIAVHKQVLAMQWACELNQKDCVSTANQMFEDYVKFKTPAEPETKPPAKPDTQPPAGGKADDKGKELVLNFSNSII